MLGVVGAGKAARQGAEETSAQRLCGITVIEREKEKARRRERKRKKDMSSTTFLLVSLFSLLLRALGLSACAIDSSPDLNLSHVSSDRLLHRRFQHVLNSEGKPQ